MALPSRNAPCPCGSGKRYKRCHGGPGSPDPFLGVSEEIVGKHRDPRTGRTRTYRNDLVIRRIRDEHPQHARAFDVAFAKDIQDISTELAVASGLIEIGVENTAQAGDADALRRLGAALGNAVNSVAGALELVRCGYTLQPGMLLRSVVECVAVVLDVVVNEESITRFRARSYSPTGAASRAKKVLGLVGHLYGVLSNYHTHVTESHETEYPLDSTGEAAASALRMVKAAAALVEDRKSVV